MTYEEYCAVQEKRKAKQPKITVAIDDKGAIVITITPPPP